MGIRPQLHFGVGLNIDGYNIPDDWQDIEIIRPDKDEIYKNEDDQSDKEFYRQSYLLAAVDLYNYAKSNNLEMWDLVVYDAEYGDPDVLFFSVDKAGYGSNYLYALAAFHEEYQMSKFHELPKLDPSDDRSGDATWWKLKRDGSDIPEKYDRRIAHYQKLLDNGHNYNQFRGHEEYFFWKAMYTFNELIGIKPKIQMKNLMLGIYFKWS